MASAPTLDATPTSELKPKKPRKQPDRVSVVIPAFNEAQKIYTNLQAVCAVLEGTE